MADLVLCKMEVDVLREVSGELGLSPWTPVKGSCFAVLCSQDLMTKKGEITLKGKRYLEDWHRTRTQAET